MRVNLNCPFEEKDEAKALGARWDAVLRTWYVTGKVDLRPFERWMTVSEEDQQWMATKAKALRAQKKADKKAKAALKEQAKQALARLAQAPTQEPLFQDLWANEVDDAPPPNRLVLNPEPPPIFMEIAVTSALESIRQYSSKPVTEHAPYVEERKPFDAEAAAIIAMHRIKKHINQSAGAHLRWFKQGVPFGGRQHAGAV